MEEERIIAECGERISLKKPDPFILADPAALPGILG